jgi:hypothetical protein
MLVGLEGGRPRLRADRLKERVGEDAVVESASLASKRSLRTV